MKIRVHFRQRLDDGTISAPAWDDIDVPENLANDPTIIVTHASVVDLSDVSHDAAV